MNSWEEWKQLFGSICFHLFCCGKLLTSQEWDHRHHQKNSLCLSLSLFLSHSVFPLSIILSFSLLLVLSLSLPLSIYLYLGHYFFISLTQIHLSSLSLTSTLSLSLTLYSRYIYLCHSTSISSSLTRGSTRFLPFVGKKLIPISSEELLESSMTSFINFQYNNEQPFLGPDWQNHSLTLSLSLSLYLFYQSPRQPLLNSF